MLLTATTIIHPVTGRTPTTATRVAVYRNLHRGAWSIKAETGEHKGRLLGHATTVALTDCTMRVGRAAAARIANGAPREVHAWVLGTLIGEASITDPTRLVYRPHERPEFYAAATGQAVWTAPHVIFTDCAYIAAH
jgi:hypothetical protein